MFDVVMKGEVKDYAGSATATIKVTVTDLDDQDPVFTHSVYDVYILENVGIAFVAFRFACFVLSVFAFMSNFVVVPFNFTQIALLVIYFL